jgi:hypothetical protein
MRAEPQQNHLLLLLSTFHWTAVHEPHGPH